MVTNDRIILDEVLKQGLDDVDPNTTTSSYFEYFTAEQVLKAFDLSVDEIEYGLVGNGGDGGIDAIFLLVNGDIVQEDTDFSHLRRDITIDLVVLQSKTQLGFQETPIERFNSVSNDLFDLSKDLTKLTKIYNERLLEVIRYLHDIWRQLANHFPTLNVSFFYACKGSAPGENLLHKVTFLEETVKKHFPSCNFHFGFLGASELLGLARQHPQKTYSLPLAETPMSSEKQVGFVCLVALRDFHKFITDESGFLRRQMFEANVRDYQGRNQVNDEIQESLSNATTEDFWWLNNGVSILATKASLAGKALTIEDPLIVNGLQTSTEVYNYFRKSSPAAEERKILAKVMVPTEEESRDRVIKATNRQTPVQAATLRATDKIHRDIEEYLRSKGLFYDRRKNYYKNEGKPRDKIIGIPYMAQAVMALLLGRPDTARARPSSLLKTEENYSEVFDTAYPINLYYVCVEAMRTVEAYLKSPTSNVSPENRTNLRFYVAMHAVVGTGSPPKPPTLAGYELTALDEETIKASLDYVQIKYHQLGGNDQVSKGTALLQAIRGNEEQCE